MAGVDLHTHSTASDGSLSPRELVQAAKEAGLEAIALTDHDTTAGVSEAVKAGRELSIEIIPGCEISAVGPSTEIHIVGLWLPEKPEKLNQTLQELMQYRHDRNRIIVEMLQNVGVDITYEEVRAAAGEGSVGRPHIAKVLLEKGVVNSVQDAFDRFLGPKGKAYAPKKVLSPEEAVGLIKSEGGLAIMAHPQLLKLNIQDLRTLVRTLMEYGLDGIEVYYSEHSISNTNAYKKLAEQFDLGISGGSDFHGAPKPKISLGRGKGNLDIPYSVVEELKKRLPGQGK